MRRMKENQNTEYSITDDSGIEMQNKSLNVKNLNTY